MAKVLSRKVTIYINGKEVENTIKSLEAEAAKLRAQQRNLVIGSEEYIETSRKLKEIKDVLAQQKNAVEGVADAYEEARKKAAEWSNIVVGMKTLWQKGSDLFNWLKGFSDEAARMDDAYADVMKTTGLTRDEVLKLNEAFKRMDTRTAREELNRLAAEAGKLGIQGVEGVASFTEAADKIKVALGEDLGEDATTVIGKMAEVYTRSTKELSDAGDDLGAKMLRIGSAINSLGAASSAAEPHMVDFLARLGGMASQAGLSAQQVLGYASALDQSGVSVEKSATAFQNFMTRMMQKPGEFAAIARQGVNEFRQLMETDMDAAIKAVLAGLNEEGGMTKLAPLFKDLQLSGQGVTAMLTTLKGSIDKVNEAQAIANSQMSSGASIEEEFAVKNNTMQARLDKAKDTFHDTAEALGNALYPAMIGVTNAGSGLMSAASGLIGFLREYPAVLSPLVALGGAWLALKLKTAAATVAEKAAELVVLPIKRTRQALEQRQIMLEQKKLEAYHRNRQAEYLEMINKEKLILTDKAYAVTVEGLARREQAEANIKAYSANATQHADAADKAHTATIRAKNAAMKATPWGAIIALATALGTAVYKLVTYESDLEKTTKEANKQVFEEQGKLKVLKERLEGAAVGSEQYKQALEELRTQHPDIMKKYSDEYIAVNGLKGAYEELSAAVRQSIYDRMYAEKAGELQGKLGEQLEKTLRGVSNWVDTAMYKFSDAERQYVKQQMNTIVRGFAEGALTQEEALKRMNAVMVKAKGLSSDAQVAYTGLLTGLDKKIKETNKALGDLKTAFNPTDTDPFGVQKMNLEQMKKELDGAKERMVELQRMQDASANQPFGATDYTRQILDQQRKVEALTEAIRRLEEEKKKDSGDAGGGALTEDKVDEKEQKRLAKERVREQKELDKFIQKQQGELAKLRKKLAGTEDESKLTEAEKAARRLAEQLAAIDEQMGGLDRSLENATPEQVARVEQLRRKYEELRREIREAGLAAIEDGRRMDLLGDAPQRMREAQEEAWQGLLETIEAIDTRTGFERWCDNNLELIEKFASQATSIFRSVNTILDNIGDQELVEMRRRNEEETATLEEQLEQQLISQEEYNQRKKELDDEYNDKEKEIRKEQWVRNKLLSAGEAAIEGALAVLKALNDKTIPSTAARIAMAATIGTLTAAQILAITSQPEPYAKGGYVPRRTVYQAGEAGPEWVASNSLLTDPVAAPIIEQLEAYQRGNRRALADIPMAQLNMPVATRAARELGRRRSLSEGRLSEALPAINPNVSVTMPGNEEMLQLWRDLSTYLKDPKNRQAVISRQRMEDFEKQEQFLLDRARL